MMPPEEPAPFLGERRFVLIRGGHIPLAGRVPETEVDVETVAGPMGVRFGHEGCDVALLPRQVAHRLLEREVVVDGADRVGVTN